MHRPFLHSSLPIDIVQAPKVVLRIGFNPTRSTAPCYKRTHARNTYIKTRMWANAQRDGRPTEYRWRLLFNAAKCG